MLKSEVLQIFAWIGGGLSGSIALGTALMRGGAYVLARRRQRVLKGGAGVASFDPATIEAATRYYIEPGYLLTDPAEADEPYEERNAAGGFFRFLDEYLATPGKHFLLILADSGMGKTSLLLNYYSYRISRKRPASRPALVSLSVAGADDLIRKIDPAGVDTLLIDAFDEDALARVNHRKRLDELLRIASGFQSVVITCRGQFFPSAESVPRSTGLRRLAPRPAGIPAEHEFDIVYIAPLDERRIRRYLRLRFPFPGLLKRWRAQQIVSEVPFVAVRPMLLARMPDLLDSKKTLRDPYQIYDVLLAQWYDREKYYAEPELLREFSLRLAANLFANRVSRGAERISRSELQPLAAKWKLDLDQWQLTSRSLLNRDAAGSYKFSHRSILEFVVAKLITEEMVHHASRNPQTAWVPGRPAKRDRADAFEEVRDYARRSARTRFESDGVLWLDDPRLLTDQVVFFLGFVREKRWKIEDEIMFFCGAPSDGNAPWTEPLDVRDARINEVGKLDLREWARIERKERVLDLTPFKQFCAGGVYWKAQFKSPDFDGPCVVLCDVGRGLLWFWTASLGTNAPPSGGWRIPTLDQVITLPREIPRVIGRQSVKLDRVSVEWSVQQPIFDFGRYALRSRFFDNPTQRLLVQQVYPFEVERNAITWPFRGAPAHGWTPSAALRAREPEHPTDPLPLST